MRKLAFAGQKTQHIKDKVTNGKEKQNDRGRRQRNGRVCDFVLQI